MLSATKNHASQRGGAKLNSALTSGSSLTKRQTLELTIIIQGSKCKDMMSPGYSGSTEEALRRGKVSEEAFLQRRIVLCELEKEWMES